MINMEVVRMEGIDTEDLNKRLVDAELKIWEKVEDIAYAVGKHPDEVYADLIVQFSEFLEKQYPTKKYPNEKLAQGQIKKRRSRKAKNDSEQLDD